MKTAARAAVRRASLRTAARGPFGAASLYPAKREAKREASKRWQAWAGNQTSSRSLVGSLVRAAARRGGSVAAQASKSGALAKRT